jgi:hypothetical protein
MATEDRIQPAGANPPAASSTAVTKAPPGHAPTTKNPVADRFMEMWETIKPHITRRALYVVVAIALVAGGYFGYQYFNSESKKTNSEHWFKWMTLSDPTEVRIAADKVEAANKAKPGWSPPMPGSLDYNAEHESVQRQLLDGFAQSIPDTTQARVARMQLGRFLILSAMRDISLGVSSAKPPPHAAEILQTVADIFEKLEPQLGDEPVLQEEAILSSGKARETLGEVEKALAAYHKLVDNEKTKNSAAGKDAATCLKRLEAPGAREEAERLARTFVKPAGP